MLPIFSYNNLDCTNDIINLSLTHWRNKDLTEYPEEKEFLSKLKVLCNDFPSAEREWKRYIADYKRLVDEPNKKIESIMKEIISLDTCVFIVNGLTHVETIFNKTFLNVKNNEDLPIYGYEVLKKDFSLPSCESFIQEIEDAFYTINGVRKDISDLSVNQFLGDFFETLTQSYSIHIDDFKNFNNFKKLLKDWIVQYCQQNKTIDFNTGVSVSYNLYQSYNLLKEWEKEQSVYKKRISKKVLTRDNLNREDVKEFLRKEIISIESDIMEKRNNWTQEVVEPY